MIQTKFLKKPTKKVSLVRRGFVIVKLINLLLTTQFYLNYHYFYTSCQSSSLPEILNRFMKVFQSLGSDIVVNEFPIKK